MMKKILGQVYRVWFWLMLPFFLAFIFVGLSTHSARADKQASTVVIPFMRLPWPDSYNGKVLFTGGPHKWGQRDGNSTYTYGQGSGLDFQAGLTRKDPDCSSGGSFPIVAMADGELVYAQKGSLGYAVGIKHDVGTTVIYYGHLKNDDIFSMMQAKLNSEDKSIKMRTQIGNSGCSHFEGNSGPNHLHLELRQTPICSDQADQLNCANTLGWEVLEYDGPGQIDGYWIYGYAADVYGPGGTFYNYDGVASKGDRKWLNDFFFLDSPSGLQKYPVTTKVGINFSCPTRSSYNSCEDNSKDYPDTQFAMDGSGGIFSDDITSMANSGTPAVLYSSNSLNPMTDDSAQFISDVTIPDGAAYSASQPLTKTWRMRNTGTSTWGSGYQLVFTSGNQMGAPSAADIPAAAPGQTVDISVNITTPDTDGEYTGHFQLRHGATYFGPDINVQLRVKTGTVPTPAPGVIDAVSITDVQYTPVVAPGTSIRPRVYVKVNSGQLLQNRGDMLLNVDGNLYSAWPHVSVVGAVNAGQTYMFEFYADNPMIAPAAEGTYSSKWRMWINGTWVGPEVTIQFVVRNGGGTRPNTPTISSPGNWSIFPESTPPTLCVTAASGVQYDFQIYDSHDIPESGWISNNCWIPSGLGPYTYKWHAKVRDTLTTLESGWSEDQNFSLYSSQLSLDDLQFSPGSPSDAENIRVYTCVHGFGDIGLGLKIEANTATDGSASGDWYWIHHLGKFCYTQSDTNTWPTWDDLPLADGDHLIRAVGFGPQGQVTAKTAIFHLNRRKPNSPTLVNPSLDAEINTRQVTFEWKPAYRVSNYRLVLGTNDDPTINPILDMPGLDPDTTTYTYTFNSAYENVYWRVYASNELGTSISGGHFSIDQTSPISTVTAPSPAVSYETAFSVTWSGSDERSGLRWYDVQYRDGNRPGAKWVDWLTNVTSITSIFFGQPGHTYYFRSRALDEAGNLESWPADGDMSVKIDPSAMPPTPWWGPAYSFKRNLLIVNNDPNGLPIGYPIHLHFDTGTSPSSSELYSASKSAIKGDDFRIIYNNTTQLTRFIQVFEAGQIDIWFDLQAALGPAPAQDPTSYQLYYGNPTATDPPDDVNEVLPPNSETGTIGIWHFTEGSGSNFYDTSGYGNNGTLYGASWVGSGKFGPAAAFGGSPAYAEISSSNIFDLTSFTIEAWVKFYDGSSTVVLLRRKRIGTDMSSYYLGTRDWKVEASVAEGGLIRSNTQFVVGRWYHIAFTYDNNVMRVYVNGNLETTGGMANGARTSEGPLVIGKNQVNWDYFKGEMQGLRISNVALSSFPMGHFGNIQNEPSTAAGDVIVPPTSGTPDLVVLSMVSHRQPSGGILVKVTVQNQGDRSTANGFDTDIYVNHLPTGIGDYTGTLSFWVDDPIAPGQIVTLTITLTNLSPFHSSLLRTQYGSARTGTFSESNATLFAQTDSTGAVNETNNVNNIYSSGVPICMASSDSFESDDLFSSASTIQSGQSQTHNFDRMSDQDWIKFTAQASQTYLIRTSSLGASADTVLSLYDTDGTTLLLSNDDYAGVLASQISWQAPAAGTYYALVTNWNPTLNGCGTAYDLTLAIDYPNHLYLPLVNR